MRLEARDKRALILGAIVGVALLAYLLWPRGSDGSNVELVAADQRQAAAPPAPIQPPPMVAPPPPVAPPAAVPEGVVPDVVHTPSMLCSPLRIADHDPIVAFFRVPTWPVELTGFTVE